MRTARRITRLLAALLLLGGVLVGFPAAMLTILDAHPNRLLPDGPWPSLPEVPEFLWHRLRWAFGTGELVLGVLIAVGWSAWLGSVWLTFAEIGYQVRNGADAVRAGLAALPPRRWIAGLVSGVIVLGSSGTADASPNASAEAVATAPRHPPPNPNLAHSAPAAVATSAAGGQSSVDEPTSPEATYPQVRVALGDSLWGLAERHLGNGRRYTEIVTLNRELLAPGGPNHLTIGWMLNLPHDATGLPDTSAPSHHDGRTVTVRPGDTLSAIATRELGDPNRWRDIYDANYRRPQPGGRALVDPDVILPGWVLRVPAMSPSGGNSVPSSAQRSSDDHESRENEQVTPEPRRSGGGDPADSDVRTDAPPQRPDVEPVPDQEPGVSLPSGAYVGLGLAALITIAMMTVWMWRRRIWVPGSSSLEDDLRMPPVVRAMRVALDIGTLPRDSDGDLVYPPAYADRPRELGVIDRALGAAVTLHPANGETVVGLADGHPIALDLARAKGLGLTGPGAPSAARSLIVALLAQGQNPEQDAPLLVMPRNDAASVLDNDNLAHVPRKLHLTSTLTAALDWIEAELLTRTRDETSKRRRGQLIVVAHVDDQHAARLKAILEAGSDVGLAAVLLGPWRQGVTIDVQPDGTVDRSEGHTDLTGARLFNLPTPDARELLDILGATDATTDPEATRARVAEQEVELATRDDAEAIPAYTPFVDNPPPKPEVDVELRKSRPSPVPVANREATDPQPPMRMNILGQTSLTYRNEHGAETPIDGLQPKQWEVLTYLALHPDGTRRDALIATIWPEAPNDRPANPFHAQLYQIRATLRRTVPDAAADPISASNKIYRLDPDAIDVDLWHVQQALRIGTRDGRRSEAVGTITEHYPGPLAPDLAPSWLEVHREQLHRQVLAILYAQARDLHDQPDRRLALLEQIRGLAPRSEDIYREIASAQAELGQHVAIDHTLRLLTASLAEIDEEPSSGLIRYFDQVRGRGSAPKLSDR